MDEPTENTKDLERRLRRRSSKRVSFADFYQVKEYCVSDGNQQHRAVSSEENEENRNPLANAPPVEEDVQSQEPPVTAASMALSILGQSHQSTVTSSVHLLPMPCVSSDSSGIGNSAVDSTVASSKSEALKSQRQSQIMECTTDSRMEFEPTQSFNQEELGGDMEISCNMTIEVSAVQGTTESGKENASLDMDITCIEDGRPSGGDDSMSMDVTRNLSLLPKAAPSDDVKSDKSNAVVGLSRRSIAMELDDSRESSFDTGATVADRAINIIEDRMNPIVADKVTIPVAADKDKSESEDRMRSIVTDKDMSVTEVGTKSMISNKVMVSTATDKDVSISEDRMRSMITNRVIVPAVSDKDMSVTEDKMRFVVAKTDTVPTITDKDMGVSVDRSTIANNVTVPAVTDMDVSVVEDRIRSTVSKRVTTLTAIDRETSVTETRASTAVAEKSNTTAGKDVFVVDAGGGSCRLTVDQDASFVGSSAKTNVSNSLNVTSGKSVVKHADSSSKTVEDLSRVPDPQSSAASVAPAFSSPPIVARGRYVFDAKESPARPSQSSPPAALPKTVDKDDDLNTTVELVARLVTNMTQLQTELAETLRGTAPPPHPPPPPPPPPVSDSPLVLSSARKSVMPAMWLARRSEAAAGAKEAPEPPAKRHETPCRGTAPPNGAEESFRGVPAPSEASRLEPEAPEPKKLDEVEAVSRGSPVAKKAIRRDTFSLLESSVIQLNPVFLPPKEETSKPAKNIGRWNALTLKKAAEVAKSMAEALRVHETRLIEKEKAAVGSLASWEQLRAQLDSKHCLFLKSKAERASFEERQASLERELAQLEARLSSFGSAKTAAIRALPTGLEVQQRKIEERMTASRVTYVAFNAYQLAFGPRSVLLCKFNLDPRSMRVTNASFTTDVEKQALFTSNLSALNSLVRKMLNDDVLEGLHFSDFIYELWSRAMPLFLFLEDLFAVSKRVHCLRLNATRLSLMLNCSTNVLNFWLDFDISCFGEEVVELKPKFLGLRDRLGTLKTAEVRELVTTALSRGEHLSRVISRLQKAFPHLTSSP